MDFDWMQIVYMIIGSFVGFMFALVTDRVIDTIKEKEEIKTLKDNLDQELKAIYELLYDSDKKEVNEGIALFDTPVWNAAIATGSILKVLANHKEYYYDTQKIYWELKTIERLQSMIKIDKIVEEKDLTVLLEETKKEVVDEILKGWDPDE